MIKEIKGDALAVDVTIVAHQTNCVGIMGGGIAKQIKEKWPNAYSEYHDLCTIFAAHPEMMLGQCQLVEIDWEAGCFVANLFGQLDCGRGRKTNYESLYLALESLRRQAKEFAEESGTVISIAVPHKLGCGLAGGSWTIVKAMLFELFEEATNIDVAIVEYAE